VTHQASGAITPHSTTIILSVMNEASSDARNKTTLAIFFGLAKPTDRMAFLGATTRAFGVARSCDEAVEHRWRGDYPRADRVVARASLKGGTASRWNISRRIAECPRQSPLEAVGGAWTPVQ
jgi:hypothetical protein